MLRGWCSIWCFSLLVRVPTWVPASAVAGVGPTSELDTVAAAAVTGAGTVAASIGAVESDSAAE